MTPLLVSFLEDGSRLELRRSVDRVGCRSVVRRRYVVVRRDESFGDSIAYSSPSREAAIDYVVATTKALDRMIRKQRWIDQLQEREEGRLDGPMHISEVISELTETDSVIAEAMNRR